MECKAAEFGACLGNALPQRSRTKPIPLRSLKTKLHSIFSCQSLSTHLKFILLGQCTLTASIPAALGLTDKLSQQHGVHSGDPQSEYYCLLEWTTSFGERNLQGLLVLSRGETVPCFSCSGTRMPALFPTVRVSVPCTLFSRPTTCVRDNYFLEKNIFTSKNETSESPSAKKIMTRELFGRLGS